MSPPPYRVERDSMGELNVPADALWGAQTQRAVENFPISGLTLPRAFIRALALIKRYRVQHTHRTKYYALAEDVPVAHIVPGELAELMYRTDKGGRFVNLSNILGAISSGTLSKPATASSANSRSRARKNTGAARVRITVTTDTAPCP